MTSTAKHTADHWLEQAALARDYALKRPASDLDGFFAALRDAEEFESRAAIAKAEGGAA